MESKNMINLNLSTLADGALQEKFEKELVKVTQNILDPNTDAETKRKVTLNLELIPNENRNVVDININVKSNLAPQVGVASTMLVGRNSKGTIEADELQSGVPGQTFFDDDGVLKTDTGEPVDEPNDDQVISLQKQRQR